MGPLLGLRTSEARGAKESLVSWGARITRQTYYTTCWKVLVGTPTFSHVFLKFVLDNVCMCSIEFGAKTFVVTSGLKVVVEMIVSSHVVPRCYLKSCCLHRCVLDARK